MNFPEICAINTSQLFYKPWLTEKNLTTFLRIVCSADINNTTALLNELSKECFEHIQKKAGIQSAGESRRIVHLQQACNNAIEAVIWKAINTFNPRTKQLIEKIYSTYSKEDHREECQTKTLTNTLQSLIKYAQAGTLSNNQKILDELNNWKYLNASQFACTEDKDRELVVKEFIRFLNDPDSHTLDFRSASTLRALPSIFFYEPFISRLEALNCEKTELSIIPEFLQKCRLLRELNFARTRITSLPSQLGLCPQLEIIDCTACNVQQLFLEFGKRKTDSELQIVCVDNSSLKIFSSDILQWPEYCSIFLGGCNTSELEDAIKDWKQPMPKIDLGHDSDEEMDICLEDAAYVEMGVRNLTILNNNEINNLQ